MYYNLNLNVILKSEHISPHLHKKCEHMLVLALALMFSINTEPLKAPWQPLPLVYECECVSG